MNIQEFYDSIDENYENVSSRMMGNQKLVEKFVRKFLEDPTYKQIKESVADCRQTRCWDHPSTIFSFKVKLYPKIS